MYPTILYKTLYISRCSRSDIKTRGEEVFIYYKEARRVLLQTSVIFSRCKPADVVYSFVFNKDIERFTVFIHYFYKSTLEFKTIHRTNGCY